MCLCSGPKDWLGRAGLGGQGWEEQGWEEQGRERLLLACSAHSSADLHLPERENLEWGEEAGGGPPTGP